MVDRLPKLADTLLHTKEYAYYKTLVSHFKNPSSLVINSEESSTLLGKYEQINLDSLQEKMMFWDMITYLPDAILTKVDRASMAVSLEVRVPMLDHRIIEFSWSVPSSLKYRDGKGKWILRQVLNRYVPSNLTERPKMGFGVPIENWLRGPLRDWAESLLSVDRIRKDGFLDSTQIEQMWNEHISGKRNWHHNIWNILMFQSWYEETLEN